MKRYISIPVLSVLFSLGADAEEEKLHVKCANGSPLSAAIYSKMNLEVEEDLPGYLGYVFKISNGKFYLSEYIDRSIEGKTVYGPQSGKNIEVLISVPKDACVRSRSNIGERLRCRAKDANHLLIETDAHLLGIYGDKEGESYWLAYATDLESIDLEFDLLFDQDGEITQGGFYASGSFVRGKNDKDFYEFTAGANKGRRPSAKTWFGGGIASGACEYVEKQL